MDLLSWCPFWPVRNGLLQTFPALERDAEAEVAIIGAGITGAMLAWELTAAGISTVVIDERDAGHGSTAGNTGLLLYDLDVPLHRLAARIGAPAAERIYRRGRAAVRGVARLIREERIDCGFETRASLRLSARQAHVAGLRREFEAREHAGLPVEWWTRSRLRRESSLPHAVALATPDAAQVDPYRFCHGLLAVAGRAGASIYSRTKVHRQQARAGGVELLCSRGRKVRVRTVVVATGYAAAVDLPAGLAALHSTYALVTQPFARMPPWPADQALLWDTSDPYLYLRATADQRILIGGYDEPFRDPRRRDALLHHKTALLRGRLGKFFPGERVDVAYAWAGTFANTVHGLPIVGPHPTRPQTWLALAYGGNGIVGARIAAEIVCAGIAGRRDRDAELFAPLAGALR